MATRGRKEIRDDWNVPPDEELPAFPDEGPPLAVHIEIARKLRRKETKSQAQSAWLLAFEQRFNRRREEEPPPTRPGGAGRPPNSEKDLLASQRSSLLGQRPQPKGVVRPPRPAQDDFEELPTQPPPPEILPPLSPSSPPPPSFGGNGEIPPSDGPPGSFGRESPDPFGRETPSYAARIPPRIPQRPLLPIPPEAEDNDNDDDEDEREVVIDGKHLDAIISQNVQLSNQVILAMGENTKIARQAADDARRNADAIALAAQRLANSSVDNANKLSQSSMENSNKLAQSVLQTVTAVGDVFKTVMTTMDARMTKSEESRLDSLQMVEDALIGKAQAKVEAASHGLVTEPIETEDDKSSELMSSLLTGTLAKNLPGLIEGISGWFKNKGGGMTEDAIKAAVSAGIAEGIKNSTPK